MARRRLTRTREEARVESLRSALEREERRVALAMTSGSSTSPFGGSAPPPPAPVTDPRMLEREYSPHPTIYQWVARLFQGELEWAQIDTIRKNAELGYTEGWADFTRRMYKTDDTVLSTMMTYVGAVSGARREVAARKGVPPILMGIASEQAEACAVMLDSLPDVQRAIAELVDGDFVGFAAEEIIWEPRGDWMYPVDLEWIHPARLRFSQHFKPYLWDRGTAVVRARELGLSTDEADGMGMPLPPNKYVVHMPRMIPDYPQGSGLLYGVTRAWFAKNWCTKYALSGAESAGVPRLIGKVLNSAPSSVREELYEALAMLAADGVGIVGEGSEISVLDSKMQGTGSIWDLLLKRMDAAITKAILGSTLNVEVGDSGGNRALGESQASMTISPRWARSGQLVANTLERQLFRPFLEMNRHLWGGHVFVPELTLHIVEDEPEVDQLAVDKGAVSYDELRRSRKLPAWGKERGGDDVIPATVTSADASIYKTQTDIDPTAAPPNDALPVAPTTPALPSGDAAPAAPAPQTDVAALAFNGAQVTALQGMLASVKDGTLTPEAAVIAIAVAFPTVSEARARAMVSAQGGAAAPPAAPGGSPAPAAPTVTESPPGGAAAAAPFARESDRMRAALSAVPPSRRSSGT